MAPYVSPTIEQLLARLSYMPDEDRALVRDAYDVAAELHRDQKRSSGDPYITHPLAVADVLIDLHADAETIAAGLLHDVVEDCGYSPTSMAERFGPRVRDFVLGVSKLSKQTNRELEPTHLNHPPSAPASGANGGSQPPAPSRQAEWAENMRQLFMSSVEHPLILVIKLADRLHNMRTLDAIKDEDKRRRIARETIEIFAPVANRLGMWQIKWELEDLSFQCLQPTIYKDLKHKIAQRRSHREQFIARVVHQIAADLAAEGIEAEVSGRPKHIYSIWRKIQQKGIAFEEVYDIHGFRVIVNSIADCYSVLGIIHSHWPPIPGEFDDYIARPKENGYQSLHTAVNGPDRTHMEVQIRTREMHELAEQGVAAHWRYKEGNRKYDAEFANKVAWLRALTSYEEDASDASEMMETMRTDIFGDRVYVFTPKGDLLSLPTGSTPVDFAYYIHSEVGHRCRGARVNGKIVRLDYRLQNRDRVEIITSKQDAPSRDWMNEHLGFVRTARARSKIKQWFRKQNREQNIAAGRQTIDRLIKQLGMRETSYEDVAQACNFSDLEDFLAAVGYGDISTEKLTSKLVGLKPVIETESPANNGAESGLPLQPIPVGDSLSIQGIEGLLMHMARCCNPLPGEPVVGYVTRGRGITVHRADCASAMSRNEPERLIQLNWGGKPQTFVVPIVVKAWDRRALLMDVTGVVAAEGINISSSTTQTNEKSPFASIMLTLNVTDAQQFARVCARLERVQNVISVERLKM